MSTPVRSSILTQFCREDLPNFSFERIIYNIIEEDLPNFSFERIIYNIIEHLSH